MRLARILRLPSGRRLPRPRRGRFRSPAGRSAPRTPAPPRSGYLHPAGRLRSAIFCLGRDGRRRLPGQVVRSGAGRARCDRPGRDTRRWLRLNFSAAAPPGPTPQRRMQMMCGEKHQSAAPTGGVSASEMRAGAGNMQIERGRRGEGRQGPRRSSAGSRHRAGASLPPACPDLRGGSSGRGVAHGRPRGDQRLNGGLCGQARSRRAGC